MAEIRTIVQVNQGSGFVTYQPDAFRSQLYDLMHILFGTTRPEADRYPALGGPKGFPSDVTPTTDNPSAQFPSYSVGGFYLGNYVFTWFTLDQLLAYQWNTPSLLLDPNYRFYDQPLAMQACHAFYYDFLPYLEGIAAAQSVPYSSVRVLLGIVNGGTANVIVQNYP